MMFTKSSLYDLLRSPLLKFVIIKLYTTLNDILFHVARVHTVVEKTCNITGIKLCRYLPFVVV